MTIPSDDTEPDESPSADTATEDADTSPGAASNWLRDALARWRVRPTAAKPRNRWPRIIFLAMVTGIVTGLAVAGLEWLAGEVMLEWLLNDAELWMQIAAPGLGLAVAAVLLLVAASRASPATADEYIRNYHQPQRFSLKTMPGKIAASIATLGSGNSLGFEGPSMFMGAGIGDAIHRRFHRLFTRDETKILMVAGAAAGVAAIFKTPATGALFALEVPYQQDLASRAVVPALVSSASSYITYVAFYGTEPIFGPRIAGSPTFEFGDLLAAAAIGLACGIGANLFARFIVAMKRVATDVRVPIRLAAAALGLATLAGASYVAYDEPLTLGPGFESVQWAVDPERGVWLILLLFLMRAAATGLSVAGGGAGGVFIPLVVQGALLGRLAAELIGSDQETLFTAVGAAAFLGAGYRTPLAAVTFVAESTGQPGLVVPGLIATALAQFLMGRQTIAPDQQSERRGHVEQRLTMPASAAMRRDVHTCPPDVPVDEVVQVHFLRARAESIPVTDDGAYLGMVTLSDVLAVDRSELATTTVADVLRTDLPTATLGWSLRRVSEAMENADVDRVAVLETDGRLAGIVTTNELIQLEDLLSDLEG